MTLNKVIEFITEVDTGIHDNYSVPIRFDYQRLDHETRKAVVNKENEFGLFLTYLYCVYQRIEMKLKEANYLNILLNNVSKEQSSVKMCALLNKAKEEYRSMDRSNFLKMYPVLKTLFIHYSSYIEYLIKQTDDIDDGENLPGTVDELCFWLEILGNWLPSEDGTI